MTRKLKPDADRDTKLGVYILTMVAAHAFTFIMISPTFDDLIGSDLLSFIVTWVVTAVLVMVSQLSQVAYDYLHRKDYSDE